MHLCITTFRLTAPVYSNFSAWPTYLCSNFWPAPATIINCRNVGPQNSLLAVGHASIDPVDHPCHLVGPNSNTCSNAYSGHGTYTSMVFITIRELKSLSLSLLCKKTKERNIGSETFCYCLRLFTKLTRIFFNFPTKA